MNVDELSQQIEALRLRFAALLQRSDLEPLSQQEIVTVAFEELQNALEELASAESELRQQNENLAIAREAVEAERQRYQDLFQFAPDGYLVTDTSGTIREANHAAATLLNARQQYLVGKPLINYVPVSERRAFRFKLKQLRQIDRVQEWEVRLHPHSSAPFDSALTVVVVRNQQGKPIALRWLLRDITERKRTEEQLLRNAFYDELTGLPNRALFMNRLEHAVEYGIRHKDYLFAVLFLDLDRFKMINDSLGHKFGDQLLIAIARRLSSVVRPTDTAARLGGDEFTILLEGIEDISDAVKVANRIQAELKLPLIIDEQEVFTTASIGIAFSALGCDRPSDLLRDADVAMYRAKAGGKARYEIFNTEMRIWAVARLQLETDLRRAIERQEFQVYYQPIVGLDTGLISGFEALVRWQHPMRGLVCPTDFIPAALENGLSIPIDKWVLATACRQTQQWQEQYPDRPPLTISVNVCGPQFVQLDLIEYIGGVLQETNLDARSLQLEITENVIMENSQSATATLDQLRSLGVQLSIDDFGTGYSSLSRLHRFPINRLKIDRSFVSRMGVDSGNLEFVETIVTLAQKLDVAVTAEGVETAEQLAQLRALKCEYGQGYLFSQPVDSSAAEVLIMTSVQW